MRIDAIDVFYVAMPLIYPWRTSYGEDTDIHSVIVRMRSGEHEGYGEVTPFYAPAYSPESAMSAYYNITEFMAPALVGKEFETPEDVLAAYSWIKGNTFAKAGPEIAWWDLQAKIKGLHLHKLLGGETKPVDAGADFGVQDSIDMLLGKVQKAVDAGHKRVKLKVRHGWDLEVIKAVTETFPKQTFHVDCNSGYTMDDLPFFKAADKYGLAMFEQPLHHTDLNEHAILQSQLETPVCLDESVKSVRAFEWALKLKSCRILNIKCGRVGGLSVSLKLHGMAQDAGITCWVGGMLESAVGQGVNIELATLSNFTYPADIFPSSFFYEEDLGDPEIVLGPGATFEPSTVPGTPYAPVPERLEKLSLYKKSFGKN